MSLTLHVCGPFQSDEPRIQQDISRDAPYLVLHAVAKGRRYQRFLRQRSGPVIAQAISSILLEHKSSVRVLLVHRDIAIYHSHIQTVCRNFNVPVILRL